MTDKLYRDYRRGFDMKKLMLMTRVRKRFNSLLKSRAGQSTTEYILILAIVVMIAGRLKSVLTEKVVKGADSLDFSKAMSDQ
jgi:prolipoprotein diacylglyceryltransferase